MAVRKKETRGGQERRHRAEAADERSATHGAGVGNMAHGVPLMKLNVVLVGLGVIPSEAGAGAGECERVSATGRRPSRRGGQGWSGGAYRSLERCGGGKTVVCWVLGRLMGTSSRTEAGPSDMASKQGQGHGI